MKKLLLVFIVFALASSVYAMCPRMAGRRGNANYKRMTECENINECPKEVNGYCIASNLICYGTKCPFKQNESFSFGRNWSILKQNILTKNLVYAIFYANIKYTLFLHKV